MNKPMKIAASKQMKYTRVEHVLTITVVGKIIARNPSRTASRWWTTNAGLGLWNLEASSYKYIVMKHMQSKNMDAKSDFTLFSMDNVPLSFSC